MDIKLTINITSKTSKPIRITKTVEVMPPDTTQRTNQNRLQNGKPDVDKVILSKSQTIPLTDYIYNFFLKKLKFKSREVYVARPERLETAYEKIDNIIAEICSSEIKLTENSKYFWGWKQIYNRFIFFNIDQKEQNLPIFSPIASTPQFCKLNQLISLLKSADTEFSMTAFSFILFSVTKSLYITSPKNSNKEINLSVFSNTKVHPCISNFKIEGYLQKLSKTIVDDCIFLDYYTGQVQNNIVKGHNINIAKSKHNYYTFDKNEYDKKGYTFEESKINSTKYSYTLVDYPIVVNNEKNSKKPPSKLLSILSASLMYIDYTDYSIPQNYIVITPNIITDNTVNPNKTNYINYVASVMNDIASTKYVSKNIYNDLEKEIYKILNKRKEGVNLISLSKKDIRKLSNCIFRKYFHRNQRVTYFDDLYRSAVKMLSFPNCNTKLVQNYSYLLASLMSFKEYVDELPTISPYYDPDDEFYQTHNSKTKTEHSFGLESDYNNSFNDNKNDDDYEEYPPTPPITDITSYKKDFYTLFDQTVEIFKKRCAVNDTADHTISYEDKLILYFEQFITELQSERSELIIPPAKEKQGLIFLNYYSYFEHFELFLEKKNFHYTISKQKFNRLLFDNKILKPRYNGNDKTSPKFDYILQVNEQKYTVIAIKLDTLKCKCDELSKCP